MNFVSVTQFNTYIKQVFEAEELLSNISILGEVSGVNVVRGVAYFNIRDADALLPCVCFNLSYALKEGEQVIVTGSPRFYVKGGKVNFNVARIQSYGLGALYQKFLELKSKLEKASNAEPILISKLEAEGLFDTLAKKPLPNNIRRIGVITSGTGAVVRDIITVATRRNKSADIVIYPVKVQSSGAENEIINALETMQSTNVDVIIIARGGGSIEDMQPFNTEALARAIFKSKIPTVSAVGHETDFTISDFVASVRAATPSAAAELVTPDMATEVKILDSLVQKIKSAATNNIINFYNIYNSDLRVLKQKMYYGTSENKLNIDALYSNLKKNVLQNFERAQNDINIKVNTLNNLNPISLLKSGYAKVYSEHGLVSSIDSVNIGDSINIYLSGGSLLANVTDKKRSN